MRLHGFVSAAGTALTLALACLALANPVEMQGAPLQRIGFIGVWDRAQPMLDEAARAQRMAVSFWRPEDLAEPSAQAAVGDCDLLFVLNVSPEAAPPLRALFARLKAARPGLRIIPLDARGVHAEFEKADQLTPDAEVPKYWRANGAVNIGRLLRYAAVTYLGATGGIEPSVIVPDFGYYDPDRDAAFETFESYRAFRQAKGRWIDGAPVAALLIQQSFWVTRDTKVIDAQVRALERQGINPVVIFADRQGMATDLLKATAPDLIVEDRHGAMWDSREVLEQLDVPYLRPISMLAYTTDEWRSDPAGLSSRDVGMFMTLQESWGTIEPIVVGGLAANIGGFHLHEPIPDGIEKFARRASRWIRLRRTPNAGKKLAVIYYNKDLGKDDLMRGSPTGAFLDGPESFMRLLPRLREHGYTIADAPASTAQLLSMLRVRGRNIGPWAADQLDTLVATGDPVLIPEATYRRWFATRLSKANQAAIVKAFGPPPGRLMVITRKGARFIVIPRIRLGNVLLTPQPERGETQDEALLHTRDTPPPHNYLAFYWWLDQVYHADAVVHWGTHGSLELLPGKEAGLDRDSWSDVAVGDLPVVNLWIMDNIAEATLSRRRSYATLVDHLPPPAMTTALPEALRNLQEDVRKFQALEAGLLQQEYRKRISEVARAERLDETLKLAPSALLSDADVARIGAYVQHLAEEQTPVTLHVLGEPMPRADQPPYLAAILGSGFLQHLDAALPASNRPALPDPMSRRAWLRARGIDLLHAVIVDGRPAPLPLTDALRKDLEFARNVLARLTDTPREIAGLLRALDGRYVTPGPGPDPIRNSESPPGGRNLYALNPEEIPTRPAWDVAVQLVDELWRIRHPKKVGMDLNGMNTMRDFGVMEAEILYLMGVRPVWDRNNLAVDVELIPAAELKRPRIDVFIAMGGQYKENFPTRVELLDKAVRLAASASEADNYVRLGTEANRAQLERRGMAPERAAQLAAARIFGTKQGNMSGTNILYLIPRSGVWDHDSEIADVYIDNMSWVYTKGAWGQKVDGLYQQAIQGTETVVRNWASNMTSQLSNHHAYEYLGGLSMAIKTLTGRQPDAFIADVRNPDGARMRDFDEVLATSYRTELLNPTWIAGMKAHGYAGAGHAAELVKNTLGWAVTRTGSVSEATWKEIYDTYVEDTHHLGVREWMETSNPHAFQEMAATMLEASRKGYWKADARTLQTLAARYQQSLAAHGDSNGIVSGGNAHLREYAAQAAGPAPGVTPLDSGTSPGRGASSPSAAALSARQAGRRPAEAVARVAAAAVTVVGQRLARTATRVPSRSAPPQPVGVLTLASLAGTVAALLTAGFLRHQGSL